MIASINELVEFQLHTGEVLHVSLMESGLGLEGYRLKVTATRGLLAVMPSSGNSIEIATLKATRAEQEANEEIARQRRGKDTP